MLLLYHKRVIYGIKLIGNLNGFNTATETDSNDTHLGNKIHMISSKLGKVYILAKVLVRYFHFTFNDNSIVHAIFVGCLCITKTCL